MDINNYDIIYLVIIKQISNKKKLHTHSKQKQALPCNLFYLLGVHFD